MPPRAGAGKLPSPAAFSRSLSSIKAKRIVLTFHSLGDIDAAASAIALSRFIGKKCIIAPPDKPNSGARKLLDYCGAQTILSSEAKITSEDFIIALDSASPSLLPHLSGIQPDLLIDHHSRTGGEIAAKKRIIDESASSTCEILHFLLKPTDKITSIALLMGIISDTANFKSATPRAFEAASALLSHSGLSYSQIHSLAGAPESFGERVEALRSCQSVSSEKVGNFIIATAMAKSHEAHFADMLTHLGADIAFVGCEAESGGARISARMRDSLLGRVKLER
ncbi:MAG: DHH family phosphoesterase, partial [Candidatus Micrarchaeia archaeon]